MVLVCTMPTSSLGLFARRCAIARRWVIAGRHAIGCWGAIAVLISGCGEAAAPAGTLDAGAGAESWSGRVAIAALESWVPVAAEHDPFADRPGAVNCPPQGYRTELTWFEVATDRCPYATFAQPLPVELRAGDVLRTTVWHLVLWAPEVAEGHVALGLGDRLLWEEFVPIPRTEAAYAIEVTVPVDVPAGTPIYFHLHNHGANSWRLLDVVAERP